MAPACKERDSQWQNICHGHRQKSTLEIGISLNAEHFIAELLLKALPLPGAQNLLLFHPARSPQPWAAFPIPGQLFPSFPIPFPALDNLSYPFPSLPQPFPGFPIPFPSPSPSFSHPIPSPAALSCSKGHFHGAKSDGNGQTPQTAGAKAVAARGSVFYLSGDTSSLTDHPTPHRETSHSSSSPSDRLSQIFYSFIPLHGHSEFMSLNCHTKQPTARGVPSLAHQKTFWLLKRKFPPPHWWGFFNARAEGRAQNSSPGLLSSLCISLTSPPSPH